MSLETAEIRSRAAEVAATSAQLRSLPTRRIAEALGQACAAIADPRSDTGREARALLGASSGLSAPMIDWALAAQVGIGTPAAFEALAASLVAPRAGCVQAPARLAVAVLSGNVVTAPLRAIALPLLARAPVVVKASSRDDVFARILRAALLRADAAVAECVGVVTFEGGSVTLEDALFAQADVVSAYGSDATLADIRARLPGTTAFVPHGHGIGAVFVPRTALSDAEAVADRIALDVAAFDQRGCLSPHAIWVEAGAEGRELARLLADRSLARLATDMPRGPLPTAAGGAQLQWRGVAAARGELLERDGYAVSFEGPGPLRLSPGYRNVSVLSCESVGDLARRLLPLGVHLKALGVAGDETARAEVAAAIPPPLAPRIAAIGEMQTPPLDALADGQPPFAGLVRWIDR